MSLPETQKSPGRLGSGCLILSSGSWLVFASILVVSLLFAEGFLTAVGQLIIYSDPIHEADVIAVLSGGGMPRLQEAARLYQEHHADFIILTETGAVTEKFGSLSSIEKNQLEALGVQPRDIFITELHVDSTTDEARVIRKMLNTRGFKSVIIVTDTYHSMRAHLIFDDAFKGNDLTIYIRPVRDDWYNAATWWTSAAGWKATLLEYSKLIAYLFQSRILH
jgi:uncharacterized SAM-binding protein YcdF (DUF218 family)